VQSARRAIESGLIGTPIAANTSMQYNGPDIFHPNPEFLFAPGAGPVFDMGPYYVTTLVSIFGSVKKASAFGVRGRDTRTIKVGERAGTEFPVLVPTHVNALLEFENGGVSQSVFSWDSPLARVGLVEIIGTEGTLSIPDPNYFEGDILVTRAGEHQAGNEWEPVAAGGVVGGRGLGIVDLLEAARDGRPHRATGDMGLHVLEALIAIDASISSGQTVALDSTVARPAPVEADWNPYRGGAE
jgi:predicted dehydrogenase